MPAKERAHGQPGNRTWSRPLLGLAALAALAAAVFAVCTVIVVRADGPTGFDRALTSFFVRHRVSWATLLLKGFTWLGSTPAVEVVALVGALLLVAWWRRWVSGGKLLVSMAGAIALKDIVKPLIDQPRPPASLWLVDVTGPSFPSGHVAQTVATYGMLAVVLGVGLPRSVRVALWSAVSLLTLLMALSRIYLGVHWMTDDVGGVALGALCITFVQMLDWAVRRPGYSGPRMRAGPT